MPTDLSVYVCLRKKHVFGLLLHIGILGLVYKSQKVENITKLLTLVLLSMRYVDIVWN